jgi:hypothetical protein
MSRACTKAITVHFPEEVRRQLKTMAGEQGRTVSDVVAEALNLFFAKYGRPELAPHQRCHQIGELPSNGHGLYDGADKRKDSVEIRMR